ncbi:MAG: WecB/TagA/CpsF family glycosyltransferase [bacterium]
MLNLSLLQTKVTLSQDWQETKALLKQWLVGNEPRQLITVNPEFVLESVRNPQFKQAIESTVSVPDGIGIVWAGHYLQKTYSSTFLNIIRWIVTGAGLIFTPWRSKDVIKERITGVEVTEWLCQQEGVRAYFLGGLPGIGERAKEYLERKYPGVRIVGVNSGPLDIKTMTTEEEQKLVMDINASEANVLVIAWNAPYAQIWLYKRLGELVNIKIGIGVGGTLNFFAGTIKRSPRVFQALGLEWLWRLLREPWRVKRIVRALRFSYLVARSR